MARPAVFINPDLNTPEDIARAQALLGALAPNYGKAANVGEGIAQLMIGIGSGVKNRKLAKAETAGRAQGNSAFEKIMGAMSGANTQFPAAPSMGGTPQEAATPSAPAPNAAGAAAFKTLNGDNKQQVAEALLGNVRGGKGWTEIVGQNGEVVRREGARNWRNNNPGNIEFGPFAKNAGAIGSDGRFAVFPSYEAGRAAKAKLLFETPSYSSKTIAGAISRYAPAFENDTGGYISAVAGSIGVPANTPISALNPQQRNAMLDAMQKVEGFKVGREMRNGAPTQVASLDPSAGMASAYAPAQQPQEMYVGQVNPNGSIGTVAQKPGIQAIAAAMGNPAPNGMAAPQQAPAPQQMAQAAPSDIPPMPQNEASSLDRIIGMNTPLGAPQPQGLDVGMLMQAAQNPWLTDTQKTMVNTLLQQEMQKQDPAYQMQQQAAQVGLQKSQIELQQMQNPGPNIKEVGGRLVQVNPDGTVTEVYAPPPEPIKEPAKPAEIQEYEYAKGQGFPGTFQDWKSSQKGGMALQVDPATGAVTFQQGGNIKPMTEAQSKDTVYAVRAEGSLPLLDDLAGELTGVQGNTLGQLPIIGNAMKPEKFQQAEQAANEFLQAILRKDTGAAITEGEQALYGNTYIPRFGDGAKVIQQKKEARYRALQAMKAGMTPQAILAQEKALQNSGNTPMAPLGTPAPAVTPNAPKRLKYNPATGELE